MLDKVRLRTRSRSISISLDLLDKIRFVCKGNMSVSAFIRMAIKKELLRRGIA
ncbi:MAG: hypothetical protein WC471_04425 [Candidatus Woesearchaeota archaeon]